ncbi:competence protein ComEC [Peptoclostridium litorale DSM 5388]|uniref:Putative membrane protein n=1 Tax=Peptoclostridium litorale DSM 5388 TaxID=1121324 RepID=A0A069RDD4_PEPLI|nr:ComEC/Rec2 family competence protein [Peptoclostridium litorale]KDR95051.1 putative membrane protein [Peptoclostridium litorale DSM 5388]SIN75840.1 competence protein ComEC [Peptoclostridium litorale DSM 5388]
MSKWVKFMRRPIAAIFMLCVIFSAVYTNVFVDLNEAFESGRVQVQGTVSKVVRGEKYDQYAVGRYIIMDFSRDFSLDAGDIVILRGEVRSPNAFSDAAEFDYGRYLRSKGYVGVIYPASIDVVGVDKGLVHYCSLVKKSLYRNIGMAFSRPEGGLVKGMIFGDKGDIGEDIRDVFSRMGIMHMFAVSGMHVGIVYFIIMIFLKNTGDFARTVAAAVFLLLYSCICDFTPSVTRASIFFILMGVAYLLRREYDVMCSLCAVGILLVLENMYVIYDISFQLSFAAVMSISSFYRPVQSVVRIRPVSISLAVSILTWPIIYWNFGIVSIVSPVTNLLTVPLLPFAMGFSMIAASLAYISLAVASIPAFMASAVLRYYVWISKCLDGFEYSSIYFESASVKLVVIYYALMAYYIMYIEVKSVKEQENAAKGY